MYAAWYVALLAKKRFRENFRIDTACFSIRERLYSLLFSPLYNNWLFLHSFFPSFNLTFLNLTISISARLA